MDRPLPSPAPATEIPGNLPEDPGESYNPGRSVELFWARLEDPAASGEATVDIDRSTGESTKYTFGTVDDSDVGEALAARGQVEYRLRRVVGEGGFGQVWEGLQESLDRVIAVKRLKADVVAQRADNPVALAHLERTFRHEALVTATLEHPNIVPVYDLGMDENRMPLLAMQLVRGRPWDEVIAEDRKLPIPDFLGRHIAVLAAVAQAVAFAHSRGVVHRDIKPSQVMLGEFGEVLLMDWGLALVFNPDLARDTPLEDSEFTPWSRRVTSPAGTPSYMAPEQTERSAARVGPWTDVFLLCGTLYTLLTGTAPHAAEDSRAAFSRAMFCEVQPPSERAPHMQIPDELAALCMKGLQPNPEDRKLTAREYIAALHDYLTGAGRRRESMELARKADRLLGKAAAAEDEYELLSECNHLIERALTLWPQNDEAVELRQKIFVKFALAALLSRDLRLARSLAENLPPGPARGSIIAEVEMLEAEQRLAEKRLAEAHRENRIERVRAEKARDQAERVVGFMLEDLYQSLQPLGRVDILDKVARSALEYFEEHTDAAVDIENLSMRALTFRHIGDVLRARSRLDEALKAYEDGRRVLERHAVPASTPRLRYLLAEHLDRKAAVLFEQGLLDDALDVNKRALAMRLDLAGEEPENPEYRNALAFSQHQEGGILWRQGRQVEALASFRSALAIRGRLLEEDPANARLKADFAYSINSESWVLRALGDIDEALACVEKSLGIREELLKSDPNNRAWEADYAWSLKSKGLLLEDKGRWHESLECFRQAVAINRRLADADPTNTMLQSELAFPHGGLARALRSLHRLDEARQSYETAVEIQMRLMRQGVRHPRHMRDTAYNLIELAGTLTEMGRTKEAEARAIGASRIAEELLRDVPHNPTFAELYGRALLELGIAFRAQDRDREARREWTTALRILEPVMTSAEFPAYQQDTIASLYLLLGDVERARPWVQTLRAKMWASRRFQRLCAEARV